ncbi:MAG TPA: PadR family transcriptional regulator [Solirubrobacterales bacterium]|jgi:DNA-binding PadR family transcriptional regulator
MKLRPASYLILGMVGLGARSGYAIKRAADGSTQFFWPMSLAQVYPELARLQSAGLLRREQDPRGGRERHSYALTEAGSEALAQWLRSSQAESTQFRDEGVLRLFFADALPTGDQRALLHRLRERAAAVTAGTREEILPAARALESAGTRGPALVARLRADTYAYVERWLAREEAELRDS